MPRKLLEAFEQDKPISFLINPPFATANNAGTKYGDHKRGVVLTRINKLMEKKNVGASSKQLYAQFLYRILLFKRKFKLTNICIATMPAPSSTTMISEQYKGNSILSSRSIFVTTFLSMATIPIVMLFISHI